MKVPNILLLLAVVVNSLAPTHAAALRNAELQNGVEVEEEDEPSIVPPSPALNMIMSISIKLLLMNLIVC